MKTKVLKIWLLATIALLTLPAQATQKFFNLTSQEVKVDSILPQFVYSFPLEGNYQDSLYTVTVKYPEYLDMPVADIANYNRLSGAALPQEVTVHQQVNTLRKKGLLIVTFTPLVFRNHRYQTLVSFMLDVKARPLTRAQRKARVQSRATSDATDIYASHSVLASGRWAKIRVSHSGIHQLTESVVRQAGFSDINQVKIYGYGGNLQNEALYASDLQEYDDLKEVPQCIVEGKHYFYAKGSVSWKSVSSQRTRNPYSDYGYYFITQTDEAVATIDSADFVKQYEEQSENYHSLYEVDGYSWYHGGRNLFDPTELKVGAEQKVSVVNYTGGNEGNLSVYLTTARSTPSKVEVLKNNTVLGTITLTPRSDGRTENSYAQAIERGATYALTDLSEKDTIIIRPTSGGPVRLDYIDMQWDKMIPCPDLKTGSGIPTAQYVYAITNQDHHADGVADMVIIIPTSQKLLKQATRLKEFHESHDGLRVTIVPADELYNEFSSGTPDANAYRRYLRMLADRAQTEADMPKYLLLFGGCVWDNRMLTSDCKRLDPDDYLLCYESENSFSAVFCYVSDSWLGILGEGMGANPISELQDVGVGRFPVTTSAEAKILVDKTINYANNQNAGSWENTLMFMGDDGNSNQHMDQANQLADYVSSLHPGYMIKKVMWDAYTRVTSSTGNTYPDATAAIKKQQAAGALIMDYAGHGMATQLSHENVLNISDFRQFKNANLPLWITASCDIMPFDDMESTIGEAALLNTNGGAVAFYGTTRTVYSAQNKYINRAFLRRVLSVENGKPLTLGDAHRLAQNDVMLGAVMSGERDVSENHLQYSLLGDPALALNLPKASVVVDSINGVASDDTQEMVTLKAGSIARIAGHVDGVEDFSGIVSATVRDSKELITCKLNDTSDDGASSAFTFYDRQKVLYQGSDSIRGGKFSITFAVPRDINYSDATGLINLYAVNTDKSLLAQGSYERFVVGGSEELKNDSIGPSIYCYLNSPSFVDGGDVNTTPYFVANITDKDGINAAGSGIGHDLQLVIDGEMAKTYVLNDNFVYDFGTYTSGSTYYSIPELEPGKHQLTFRAWDILNNSSTTTLHFNVVKGLRPQLFDVGVTQNPAKTSTTFIISHDRVESDMDVVLEIFDTSGRMLWRHAENGVATTGNYTITWDLTIDGGRPLGTGVYLYRVKVAADGSSYASKTRKLIISR